LGGFVGHEFAGDGVGFGGAAVPAGERLAAVVGGEFDGIAGEHGVAAFDVLEVAQDGAGRQAAALGAEVPLQVADPEDHFGDGGGARVDFEAEELVRVDGEAFDFETLLGVAELGEGVEDFAFEPLHVFERDVEEVAGAAGGVEDAGGAQFVVPGADEVGSLTELAFVGEQQGGGLGVVPVGAQRLDDGGQDEAVDVGARGVMGAEVVAFKRVEGAFEQGAEDGGLDFGPVGAAGFEQEVDLVAVERQNFGIFEQLAVEARQPGADGDGELAFIHRLPEFGNERDELLRGFLQGLEQGGERALVVDLGQQADVFGEHREEAAREKGGDSLGGVSGFQRLGDAGEADGNFARGAGGAAGGVEAVRVVPDGLESGADFRPGEVVEPDAVAARVGEGGVAAAGAGEFGVELDDVADIEDDEKGRAAFVGRQVAGVVFGLAAGAQQGVVEFLRGSIGADFLGLADEGGAPVAVDEAVAGAAVAVVENDAALEDVGVVAGVLAGRLWRLDFEQGAEVGDEKLVVGALGTAGVAPAGEEGVDVHDVGIVARWLRSTSCQRQFSTRRPPTR
jgi:hypothetical protein